jgi:SAM-dependent methyltransferase
MDQDELKLEWETLAPAWIKEAREGTNANRAGLLDEPMLKACGDIRGLRILDCGCGEGRFSRMLAGQGARHVLGLDLCGAMIEAAQELQSQLEEYRVADVQDLGFIGNDTFDIVVSYLNQCDLPDSIKNNREVFRVLKSGGRFIAANVHPMRSAVGGWHKAESGEKLHVVLDHYFDESERHWEMMGAEVTNFHRSLSTYVDGFLNTGFSITGIIEPTVIEEHLIAYPELEDELRVPNFIIYKLKKP